MSKYQIMCFSPTGNTLYLAKHLKDKLNCEIISVNDKVETEHLILMSSIHAFKIPSFLKDKVKNIKKLSIIAVGCNTTTINKAAATHVLKRAKKEQVEVMTYQVLAMPLTIVKKFDIEYGKQIIKESIEKIDTLGNAILKDEKNIITVPFKSKLIAPIHYIEIFFVRLFGLELYANKNCTKCNLCIKNCPKQNIKMKKKPKFGLKCMMCMKCIYQCPTKAIHPRLSKFIEIKDYSLKEYIKEKK